MDRKQAKFTTPFYSKLFGTPPDMVAEQLCNAHACFEAFRDSLAKIEFNARDYGATEWMDALNEREQVREALNHVERYLLEHIDASLEKRS